MARRLQNSVHRTLRAATDHGALSAAGDQPEESAMARHDEIEGKLWKALKSDRIVMLGLAGVDEGHCKPMSGQIEEEEGGPIWFFTAKDTDMVRAMDGRHRAVAHFAAKDHDLFASLQGELVLVDDRAAVDRLWNRFVAAWYEGGKDDPQLQLMCFEPESAQVWLNENHLLTGVKLVLGIDPKKDYARKVAHLNLDQRT
jgi:general stress protein 26